MGIKQLWILFSRAQKQWNASTVWHIEKTISLALSPSSALRRLYLKQSTLSNKAVGAIWRSLAISCQRRQGPLIVFWDLFSLWTWDLFPDGHNIPYTSGYHFKFWNTNFFTQDVSNEFLWPLRLWSMLVLCLYNKDYLQTTNLNKQEIKKKYTIWIFLIELLGGVWGVHRFTTLVGWLWWLQLTGLSRSSIVL